MNYSSGCGALRRRHHPGCLSSSTSDIDVRLLLNPLLLGDGLLIGCVFHVDFVKLT